MTSLFKLHYILPTLRPNCNCLVKSKNTGHQTIMYFTPRLQAVFSKEIKKGLKDTKAKF